MTGTELITLLESFVDDELDQDTALALLNNAKDKLESERDWSFLKTSSSSSATTAAITLPSNYSRTIAIYVGTTPYLQIPFEQQRLFVGSGGHWYLDLASNALYLTGSNLSGTMYHYYIKKTDDLTTSTEPVWPSRFHKLLAFDAAELYYAVDGGDRGRSWDDKFALQRELIRRSMVDWDVRLQARAYENQLPDAMDYEVPLSLM